MSEVWRSTKYCSRLIIDTVPCAQFVFCVCFFCIAQLREQKIWKASTESRQFQAQTADSKVAGYTVIPWVSTTFCKRQGFFFSTLKQHQTAEAVSGVVTLINEAIGWPLWSRMMTGSCSRVSLPGAVHEAILKEVLKQPRPFGSANRK